LSDSEMAYPRENILHHYEFYIMQGRYISN